MATPRFNANIITAARRLKDARTDATSAGDGSLRFTSAILSGYQNLAIREIIRDLVAQLGDRIDDLEPSLVKDSGTLTLVAGVVAKPADCLRFIDLRASDNSAVFTKLTGDVSRILAGKDVWVPTATRPAFYEDATSLYAIPTNLAIATKGRYIISPTDITPSNLGAGSGGTVGSITSYTAATRTLVASIGPSFTSADVGKIVAFGIGSGTYVGRIESYSSANTVVLSGFHLPSGNLGAGGSVVMVSDSASGDVILSPVWDSLIVDKMVLFGMRDMAADASLG